MENFINPDQMASSEASGYRSTVFSEKDNLRFSRVKILPRQIAGLQIFFKIGGLKGPVEQKVVGHFSEMMGPSISN